MTDHPDLPAGAAERAVEALTAALGELDEERLARVEAARAVARQLDHNSHARTGSAGMATAALAREFRAILDELMQRQRDADWDGLVARLTDD
jgi:hypothetical protein